MSKARAVMIQGTASSAGKSLLTAGLCRIFARQGYRVAPFKAQNMALNSFITANGLEMGRAQVVQAECAGTPPDIRMNPVLLKPNSERGSQVIVNGVPIGNMQAAEYHAYKKNLIPAVRAAYESLGQDYDIIVIEGAGSPAEINLRAHDFVNMGMAEIADAPVLLVGDIDRGGVFAALYGTFMLLQPNERARIKGMIINKFRGDPAILQPGIEMLAQKFAETGLACPVLGVVPWLPVDIDDEDSLSSRFARKEQAVVDIALIRFPRTSNFTDFIPLEGMDGVSVRWVNCRKELGEPDFMILPGTKSTMDDLRWLRQNGLEAAVLKQVESGTPLLGICGGYQMLGKRLRDPQGAEGGGEIAGMGLLEAETQFVPEKVRRQVRGKTRELPGFFSALGGLRFAGYEIHTGRTVIAASGSAAVTLQSGEGPEYPDGAVAGNVMGSYVHGLFDSAEICTALAQALAAKKGIALKTGRTLDAGAARQVQYEQLADALEAALDMRGIEEILQVPSTRE